MYQYVFYSEHLEWNQKEILFFTYDIIYFNIQYFNGVKFKSKIRKISLFALMINLCIMWLISKQHGLSFPITASPARLIVMFIICTKPCREEVATSIFIDPLQVLQYRRLAPNSTLPTIQDFQVHTLNIPVLRINISLFREYRYF